MRYGFVTRMGRDPPSAGLGEERNATSRARPARRAGNALPFRTLQPTHDSRATYAQRNGRLIQRHAILADGLEPRKDRGPILPPDLRRGAHRVGQKPLAFPNCDTLVIEAAQDRAEPVERLDCLGVEIFSNADQECGAFVDVVHDVQQIDQTAGERVKVGDDKYVARLQRVESGVQTWTNYGIGRTAVVVDSGASLQSVQHMGRRVSRAGGWYAVVAVSGHAAPCHN